MIVIGSSGVRYQLADTPFKSGGEGNIYDILNSAGKVAKIYDPKRLTSVLKTKIEYMVNNPPNARVLDQIAWSLEVLYNLNKPFCSFVLYILH